MTAGRKVLCLILMLIVAVSVFTATASADTGPKASVRVNFTDLPDALCYGTLLSEHTSTGPNSVWDGDEEHKQYYGIDESIWRAFVEYEDADGYNFLQITWCVSETEEISWTYYPPSKFKILLYFPESGKFAVSDVCERYAFDTYYNVDMSGFDIKRAEYDDERSTDERIQAYQSYQIFGELGGFLIRLVITLAIEIGIATLFELGGIGTLVLIGLVNLVTQFGLNIFLNLSARWLDGFGIAIAYIVAELTIILIEAGAYMLLISRRKAVPTPRARLLLYATVANLISFGFGLVLAKTIPSVF